MKKSRQLLIPLLVLFFTFAATAETFNYPGDNPIFSINFPDDWSIETDEELLHATPADESIYVGLWAVQDAESIEDALDALESSLGDLILNAEFGETEEFENNGIAFIGMDGVGVDEENNDLNISVAVFSPDGETFCIMFYLGTPDAEAQYQAQLTEIIMSVTAE